MSKTLCGFAETLQDNQRTKLFVISVEILDLSSVTVTLVDVYDMYRPGSLAVDNLKTTNGNKCAVARSLGGDTILEIDLHSDATISAVEVLSRSDAHCEYQFDLFPKKMTKQETIAFFLQ